MEYIEKVEAGILACRQRISPKPGGTDHTGGNRNVDVQLPDRLERTVGTAFRPRRSIKQATAYDEACLREFAEDGLVEFDENQIRMTPEGRLFVRNVAASLDKLMLGTNKSFSKPV